MQNKTKSFAGDDASEALRIINVLSQNGFIAYLAGGCVRDALLGKTPKDYDVATDATPETIRQIFGKRHTLAFGASFGVIGVLPTSAVSRLRSKTASPDDPPVMPTEVATFRSDGTYSDGRRPDEVRYGNAREDAMRRDFTINGLFYDPAGDQIIDYVGGQDDLQSRVLRTIGSADQRFSEDRLRMLRAIRFATTTGFQIDPATFAAITQQADQIHVVSGERVGAEMRRVLTSAQAIGGLRMLQASGLSASVLPEINQINLERAETFFRHLNDRHFSAALACLVLASAQPNRLTKTIAKRWKLSTEETRRATTAVNNHEALIRCHQLAWSEVQPKLVDRDIKTTLAVADAVGMASEGLTVGLELVRERLAWPVDRLNPAPLLSGDDLRAAGYRPGPNFRVWLGALRCAQLDGQIESISDAWGWMKEHAGPNP